MNENLSSREELILRTLVEEHIRTAEPVSSRTISRMPGIDLSPASVRNTLADLEDIGMILKPHTSAGRIPADGGYCYYIEKLMRRPELREPEREAIDAVISTGGTDLFEMLEGMAKVLSRLSHQLGLIFSPSGERLKLFHIDVHRLSATRVMMILTMTSGLVRSVILDIEHEIDARRLSAVSALANERLSGLPLEEIRDTIRERLADVLALRDVFLMSIVESAENIFRVGLEERIHYFGTSRLLEQPEFQDFDRLRSLIYMLENPSDLMNVVSLREPGEGRRIRISRAVEGFAIVCSPYETGKEHGTMGIIGPPRMDYSRAMAILSYACYSLSGALNRSADGGNVTFKKDNIHDEDDIHNEGEHDIRVESHFEDENDREVILGELDTELKIAIDKAAEFEDKYIRLAAEFDNYKKRRDRIFNEQLASARDSLVRRMLDILDNFERALESSESLVDVESVIEGVELIYKQMQDLLASENIVPISAEGESFDPTIHEAVAVLPCEDDTEKVLEVVQKGYRQGDRLVRPAKVIVGKPKSGDR